VEQEQEATEAMAPGVSESAFSFLSSRPSGVDRAEPARTGPDGTALLGLHATSD
jgi:hypothetical protein